MNPRFPTNMHSLRLLPVLSLAAGLVAGVVFAADYAVTGRFVPGGGASNGGAYRVDGAAGDTAGGESAGGPYRIRGENSLMVVASEPGAPVVIIRLQEGRVLLEWPVPSAAHVLEELRSLSDRGGWKPSESVPQVVGGRATVDLGPADGVRYLRLRRE